MKKKFNLKVDIVESKKKIFVHVNKKQNVIVTEKDIKRELKKQNITFGDLKIKNSSLFVFDLISNDIEMTDLIKSYGASELPVYTPEAEETKPTRKTTTRKPRTRRKTATTKKQTDN